jgi:exosortase
MGAKTSTDSVALARGISIGPRHLLFGVLWLSSTWLFWQPLGDLIRLSLRDENSSHIPLILPISLAMIWLQRSAVFQISRYSPVPAAPLFLAVAVTWYLERFTLPTWEPTDRLSVLIVLIVISWVALFLFCYGAPAVKAAWFPLSYLFLMIPFPAAVTGHLIGFLQSWSADASYAIFRLMGTPVLRDGFHFSLPGVDIEVAQQCSGIHAALSLFVAGLLAAHFVLQAPWKEACFALCILPIAILKNAIRIVTIAWVGIHVNPAVFDGPLHRRGGLIFGVVAFALMALLLWFLKGSTARRDRAPHFAQETAS